MKQSKSRAASHRKRMGVARFWYEGNAFCLLPATRADFERREWRRGREALEAARGIETELAAVSDFADANPEWDVVLSRCASALPAGRIDDTVFQDVLAEILADFRSGEWDALYLSLHGAAITSRSDAPDLELVRAVRAEHPGVPIGASFDMHGNLAPEFAKLLSIACGYRTHPHVDMRATARRTLDFLRRIADGELRPVGVLRNDGRLLSSANMRTDVGPMADLQRKAQALVVPPLLDVSVFGGFPYANSSHSGASVMAWADGDRSAAEAVVTTLSEAIASRQGEFDIPLITPADGLRLALRTPGLVAVTDAGDNPGSGGIGDTPGLLRAIIELETTFPVVHAGLSDAALVRRAHAAGIGATLEVALGGQRTADYGEAVHVRATVTRLTDGHFINTGPMERGAPVDCGNSAVLRSGSIDIIVTEHVTLCNDPAFFALHGIDLDATRLLCVKAKNHFRAAFAAICATIIDVDAPGPASLNLQSLPLLHTRL